MAAKVYEPAVVELREALDKVQQKLAFQKGYLGQWLETLARADTIVFEFDRAAWDAAFANVSSDVLGTANRSSGPAPAPRTRKSSSFP